VYARYATTSKRVNVGKLKKDIWGHLDEHIKAKAAILLDSADKVDVEKTREGEKECALDGDDAATLSFQEVVSEVAREQQQSDITVSFYFICLLHLANEKVR
jgi:condensin complex subunit 2